MTLLDDAGLLFTKRAICVGAFVEYDWAWRPPGADSWPFSHPGYRADYISYFYFKSSPQLCVSLLFLRHRSSCIFHLFFITKVELFCWNRLPHVSFQSALHRWPLTLFYIHSPVTIVSRPHAVWFNFRHIVQFYLIFSLTHQVKNKPIGSWWDKINNLGHFFLRFCFLTLGHHKHSHRPRPIYIYMCTVYIALCYTQYFLFFFFPKGKRIRRGRRAAAKSGRQISRFSN